MQTLLLLESVTAAVAWRSEWGELRPSLVREACRVLRWHDAEDATQEALLRAWRAGDKCLQPEQPASWMLQITRREAYRLGTGVRRRQEVPLDSAAFAEAERPAVAGADEREIDLALALGSLSQRDRDLIRLRYFEDLTHAQIAQRLDAGEGAVRVRLHRALERLRRQMTHG